MSPRRIELNRERLRAGGAFGALTAGVASDDAPGPAEEALDTPIVPVTAEPLTAPVAPSPSPQLATTVPHDRSQAAPRPRSVPRRPTAARRTAPPESVAQRPSETAGEEEATVLLNTAISANAIKGLHAASWDGESEGDKSRLVRAAILAELDAFDALTGSEREAALAELRAQATNELRVPRVYQITRSIRDRLVALNRDEQIPLRALPRVAIERRYGPGASSE